MAALKRFLARHGIDNNGKTLANVADPTSAQEAATKGWAEAAILASKVLALLTGERYKVADKGIVATGTITFNFSEGTYQCLQAQAGNPITLAFSNLPAAGEAGIMVIEGKNLGLTTVTFPTINWLKSDGTFTTTFSQAGPVLQSAGTDFIVIWTRTGSTTLYGKVLR